MVHRSTTRMCGSTNKPKSALCSNISLSGCSNIVRTNLNTHNETIPYKLYRGIGHPSRRDQSKPSSLEQQWYLVASLHDLPHPGHFGKKEKILENKVHRACPKTKRRVPQGSWTRSSALSGLNFANLIR